MKTVAASTVLRFHYTVAFCLLIVALATFTGCSQTKSPALQDGMIRFSGYDWRIKLSDSLVGPGPNRFASDEKAVFVDEDGKLHLILAERDGNWYSTEIVTSEPVGYGTYVFELEGRLDLLDPNVVLGMFTWDDNTFPTDANAELDVEISRWTEPDALNLYFSVQPTRGPDVPEGKYHERYAGYMLKQTETITTHRMHWTPDVIHYSTYEGSGMNPEKLVAAWTYQPNHPPRRAPGEWANGTNSEPVGIPKPGPTTHARINLWLVDGDGDGVGDSPSKPDPIEVVVREFRFEPLERRQ